MGKVTGNWVTGRHSGRACRHEDIYTRVVKKTGACYSAKLCNPNTNWTDAQMKQRVSFGLISKALNTWLKEGKETPSADYLKVKRLYDRQSRYATMRGMMYAKGMYRVDDEGNVTVDITANTQGAVAGGSGSSGGSVSGGGGGSDVDSDNPLG